MTLENRTTNVSTPQSLQDDGKSVITSKAAAGGAAAGAAVASAVTSMAATSVAAAAAGTGTSLAVGPAFAPFVASLAAAKTASLPLAVVLLANPVGAAIASVVLTVGGAAAGYKIAKSIARKLAILLLASQATTPIHAADIAFMTVNAGSTPTILKTTDGGTSWSAVYTGGSGTALRDIFAVDADTIYAVGDINLKSTDGGATWQQIFAGLSLNGVTAANADKVIAVGQGASPQGRVIVSDNGGTSHTQVLVTPPFASSGTVFNRVDAVSATTAYLVGSYIVSSTNNSAIYKTTDGGATWTLQFNSGTSVGNAIDAVSSNVAYAAIQSSISFSGTALKTSNGTSWAATAGTFSQLRAVAAWDENLVYVAGNSGGISKSTNGGSSWSNLSSGTASLFNDIAFLDQDRLIAVGQFGIVRRTINGGTSWQDIAPAGYSSHIFTAVTVVPEPSTILLAAIACGILAWRGRKSIR